MVTRNNKKGDISMSFSWVFMIIVGVFFIALAYNIIDKYMQNEEIKYENELKDTLRGIFNDFGRTTGTEKNSLAPLGNIFRDSEVEILCNDGIPILSINGNYDANNEYLHSYPTFMTYIDQGKVDFTYMAVENFKMPFKITNMLAIVSRKNLLVIDSSSNVGEKLGTKFKKTSYNGLNYLYIDFTDTSFTHDYFKQNYVVGKNLDSIVFITDKLSSPSDFAITLSDFTELAFLVEIDETGDSRGIIKYTNQQGEIDSYPYVDYDDTLALPTMALFSSPQTFNCSYNLLLSSIETSYDFYINKTQYFINLSDNNILVCLSSYNAFDQGYYFLDLKDAMINVKTEVKNHKFNNNDDVISNIKKLETQYYILENINCPYIY